MKTAGARSIQPSAPGRTLRARVLTGATMIFAPVALATALGLALGSFCTVVLARAPRGRSVVGGRSRCRNCGHAIRPCDLVPIFSWLALRGRCRDCTAPIGRSYPAIEALGGLAGAAAGWALVRALGG
ncbi:MAG: prepilin peptidase [Vulcanimicrobiaceae bacterium]